MTEFILVPGMFTGAHVWEETAAHLVSAGSGAHTVTLTGLGGSRGGAADAVGLETHIEDVLAVIDSVAAGTRHQVRVVLCGHR
ncbi:alpha/beta hydrolase, partial [Streptomyces sp. NPDC047939]